MPPIMQLVLLILFFSLLFIYSLNSLLCILLIVYGRLLNKKYLVNTQRSDFYRSDLQLREKIAIAAAGVAIKMENDMSSKAFAPPPTAIVSAWQAVMRSDILKRHGRLR